MIIYFAVTNAKQCLVPLIPKIFEGLIISPQESELNSCPVNLNDMVRVNIKTIGKNFSNDFKIIECLKK